MSNFITVRKVKSLKSRLIECQAEYPHFTKVLVILKSGVHFVYDYINESINDLELYADGLICECSFIQKDLLTGRDIVVIYADYKDVH